MTVLLAQFSTVLTFVLDGLGSIIATITANPVLLVYVALGVAGALWGFATSFMHT